VIEGYVIGRNPNPRGHGLNMLEFNFTMRPHRGAAGTITGRAQTLRQKLRRVLNDAKTREWLAIMSTAWDMAIEQSYRPFSREVSNKIMNLAAMAGEEEFAKEVLLPLSRREAARRRAA
jgi:hypothetical protein